MKKNKTHDPYKVKWTIKRELYYWWTSVTRSKKVKEIKARHFEMHNHKIRKVEFTSNPKILILNGVKCWSEGFDMVEP